MPSFASRFTRHEPAARRPLVAAALAGLVGCSVPTEPTAAGQLCEAPAECYAGVDPGELRGEVLCVSEFQYGYCTHECVSDADCCAAAGECEVELTHVCARPDDAETRRCLLSCHTEDLVDGYEDDPDGYCGDFMFRGWKCVSSAGGDAFCAP